MKQVNLSLQAQVAYMLLMGIGLLLVPNIILPLFKLSTTSEVWVRVIGALALTFASYYYVCITFRLKESQFIVDILSGVV